MEPIAIIVIAVLAVAGVGYWLYKRYRTKQQRKAEAFTLHWVERVERATTDEQIVACGSLYLNDRIHAHLTDKVRERAAESKYQAAANRAQTAKLAQEAHSASAPDLAYLCIDYHTSHKMLDTEAIFGIPSDELGQLFTDVIAQTLEDAHNGSLMALHGYAQVMSHYYLQKFCDNYGAPLPTYPADWDDIVVQLVETPSVSDFKNTPDQSIGQVQMKAAMALRTHDLKTAKLVLAYCLVEREEYGNSVSGYGYSYGYVSGGRSKQVIWPFRDAIGDVLLADLINMVEAGTHASSSYREALEA